MRKIHTIVFIEWNTLRFKLLPLLDIAIRKIGQFAVDANDTIRQMLKAVIARPYE